MWETGRAWQRNCIVHSKAECDYLKANCVANVLTEQLTNCELSALIIWRMRLQWSIFHCSKTLIMKQIVTLFIGFMQNLQSNTPLTSLNSHWFDLFPNTKWIWGLFLKAETTHRTDVKRMANSTYNQHYFKMLSSKHNALNIQIANLLLFDKIS